MFQLSKKVEYGLIAMRHMASGGVGRTYTAKEIADAYHLPYELLAKVMQRLVKEGLVASFQGVNGGYALARNPNDLKVSEIINAIEGEQKVTVTHVSVSDGGQAIVGNVTTGGGGIPKKEDTTP